jgi:murein DD-endopeptidase MepM/ murein hydrolase activator NlpD
LIFNKKKYRFDPVTLTYQELKTDRKKRFFKFFFFLLASILLTILSGYLLSNIFDTPETRLLKKEVLALDEKMQQLLETGNIISSDLHNELFPRDNTYRIILQIDTLPLNMRDAGAGGSVLDPGIIISNDVGQQLDNMVNKLNRQLEIQTNSYMMVYEKALKYSSQLTHIPAILPVAQNDLVMISNDFGVRTDPINNVEQIHSGLDFVAPTGKNVYATGDGSVTFVQLSRTGYGNEIIIDHAFEFSTRYGHLDTILVCQGQKIKRGQLIGKVGKTGRTTGPHLHYEVLYEKKPMNPAFYYDTELTSNEYKEILNIAAKTPIDVP